MKTMIPMSRRRWWILGGGLAVLLAAVLYRGMERPARSAPGNAAPPIAVESAVATRASVPVFLAGLGTVQGYYTVTVSPRVDGELVSVGFVEGQMVKKGDLLAQIDPRPYQAALDQAVASKAKDVAQLANARIDLQRYEMLAPDEFTSKQTLETQRALVNQLQAQIDSDQAAIDSARVQLDYTTIRSPIPARTGIRLVDPGNIVHAATATGIVVLTQVQPITVLCTLPADTLGALRAAMAAGPVPATVYARDNQTPLAEGKVALIDNQVDPATGTIRVKAIFANEVNKLWPGDFVNVRVLAQTRRRALTVPSTAVQRGPSGVFAYVVGADDTVEVRPLVLGDDSGTLAVVEKGLEEGERVTTSNQYRLQPGAKIKLLAATPAAPAKPPGGKAP